MISLDECRKLSPNLANASDEQVKKVREQLYELGQLALECWMEDNGGSKNPLKNPIGDNADLEHSR